MSNTLKTMKAKMHALVHKETACSSTLPEPADDNKWNRDLALACKALSSLDARQICLRCQDIIEIATKYPHKHVVDPRVYPALDDPACGLCNAIESTEKRKDVQFCVYNLTTGTVGVGCLILSKSQQNGRPGGQTTIDYDSIVVSLNRPWFDPWPKDPSKVDLQHLKHSLAYCQSNHIESSCTAPRVPVGGLRLLNCTNRVIERATVDAEYVALSYVWGSNVSNSSSRPGGQIRYNLTIEDAIIVTLKFDYTYLWVDQLCIDQEGSHMEEQIRQMDLIYQNADLTIFAAAGEDASHGLPGITTTSRSPRMFFRNGNTLFYEMKRPADRLIEDSRWNTRGWTFQEWVFSRRRVIFTETEAFFVCNTFQTNAERGSECAPRAALLNQQLQPPHRQPSSRLHGLPNGVKTDPLDTGYIIATYTKRSLTYSSDALNAIEGVFRAFQRRQPPTYNFWGIPVIPKTLFWFSGKDEQTDISPHVGFIIGLSWTETSSKEQMFVRESEFPSWTWAGWKCIGPRPRDLHWEMIPREHFDIRPCDDCKVTGIHFELSDGRLLSWKELVELSFLQNEPQAKAQFIWLEAPTIGLYIQWETSFEYPRIRIETETAASGPVFVGYDDARISRCQDEDAVFPGMQEKKMTGIILFIAEMQRFTWYAEILLVEEKTKWAERVGSLPLEAASELAISELAKCKKRWLRLK